MGSDKALVRVGGRAMAVIVAAALRAGGATEVFAVGGDAGRLGALGLRVAPDAHPGDGPLGGLLTALATASEDLVVVLACDLPRASGPAVAATVAALARSPAAGVAVPVVDGRPHPLHAAWRRSAAQERLVGAFAAGRRAVHPLLDVVGMVAVEGIAPAALADADSADDLRTMEP